MTKPFSKKVFQNLLLLFVTCVFTIAAAEVILRIMKENKYYVWPPDMQKFLFPSTDIFSGIYDTTLFKINSEGIRGNEFSDSNKYKILTIGGSTTECLYLDQYETWSYLIQKKLNEKFGKNFVWVGNVGKAGHTTFHHILQVEKLLEQYPQIDAIILLIGINDFQRRLNEDEKFQPSKERISYSRAFEVSPHFDSKLPFFKKTEIWSMLSKLKNLFLSKSLEQDIEGNNIKKWRKNRQESRSIRSKLPDLNSALDEYTSNITEMINIVKNRKRKIIFLTQPTMWKAGLSKDIQNLFWFGGTGNYLTQKGKDYYSPETLEQGMNKYNSRLLEICEQQEINCIDLSSLLPKDTSIFYDDCHFNENGARRVAEIIVNNIKLK